MEKDNELKIYEYLKNNRKKFITILDMNLQYLESYEKLKLNKSILSELLFNFEKSLNEISWTKLKNDLTDNILSKIDYSEVEYENLIIQDANDLKTLAETKIILDPQRVYEKSLFCKNFNNITFGGIFNDCNICGANFTGSRGALIDIATVKSRVVDDCVFRDATIYNLSEAESLSRTNFAGANIEYALSEREFIEELKKENKTLSDAYLALKISEEEAEIQNILQSELKEQYGEDVIVKSLIKRK